MDGHGNLNYGYLSAVSARFPLGHFAHSLERDLLLCGVELARYERLAHLPLLVNQK